MFSGRASSVRISSRMPLPVTERARPGQQPAVRERVIGGCALQVIDRRGGQSLLHQEVVHQVGLADALEVRQPASMTQHVAHRDVGLAVRAELRPVLGDGGVVVEQARSTSRWMTVDASALVAENTIAPVSADHRTSPFRSDHPVQTSTTGLPSMYTDSAPPPNRRPGNSWVNNRTTPEKSRIGRPLHAARQAAVGLEKRRRRHGAHERSRKASIDTDT